MKELLARLRVMQQRLTLAQGQLYADAAGGVDKVETAKNYRFDKRVGMWYNAFGKKGGSQKMGKLTANHPKSSKAGRPYAVSSDMNAAVYEIIAEKLRTAPNAAELEQKFAAFKIENSSYRSPLGKEQKQLTYQTVVELSSLMEIPLKDIFEKMGIECRWPFPEMEDLDRTLLSLSNPQFKKIPRLMENLVPPFYLPDSEESKNILLIPLNRVKYAINNGPYWRKERSPLIKEILGEDCPKQWNWLYAGNGVQPSFSFHEKHLMRASQILRVSPAWLFGWSDGECKLLAGSPENESILAMYCFCSDESKLIFRKYLKRITEEAGGENNG